MEIRREVVVQIIQRYWYHLMFTKCSFWHRHECSERKLRKRRILHCKSKLWSDDDDIDNDDNDDDSPLKSVATGVTKYFLLWFPSLSWQHLPILGKPYINASPLWVTYNHIKVDWCTALWTRSWSYRADTSHPTAYCTNGWNYLRQRKSPALQINDDTSGITPI